MNVCLPLRVVCCAVAFIYKNMFCDPENDVCYTVVDQFSGSSSALVHVFVFVFVLVYFVFDLYSYF